MGHARQELSYKELMESRLPSSVKKFYRYLKAVGQCHVVLGLGCFSLGSLYFVNRGGLASLIAGVTCGLYFMITGMLGVCGAASYRRRLLISYLVLCLHSAILFCPLLFFSSNFNGLLESEGCQLNCTTEPSFHCEITCMKTVDWSLFNHGQSSRVSDTLLMGVALIESTLCLLSVFLYWRLVVEKRRATNMLPAEFTRSKEHLLAGGSGHRASVFDAGVFSEDKVWQAGFDDCKLAIVHDAEKGLPY